MNEKVDTGKIRSLFLNGEFNLPNIVHDHQQLILLLPLLLDEIDRLNKVADALAAGSQSESVGDQRPPSPPRNDGLLG